jgi:hypothetical protein
MFYIVAGQPLARLTWHRRYGMNMGISRIPSSSAHFRKETKHRIPIQNKGGKINRGKETPDCARSRLISEPPPCELYHRLIVIDGSGINELMSLFFGVSLAQSRKDGEKKVKTGKGKDE